jgi:hypothetical protein
LSDFNQSRNQQTFEMQNCTEILPVWAELPHAGRRKADTSQLRVVFAFISEKSKNPGAILGTDLKLLITDLNLNLYDNRRYVFVCCNHNSMENKDSGV